MKHCFVLLMDVSHIGKKLGKLTVTADRDRNRLSLLLSGVVTKKKLGELYTELRFCASDLQPKFDVFTDLSECTFVFLNIIPTFRNILGYLLNNSAGEMVCVVADNTIVKKQIQLATVFQGYKPGIVSTLAEAEKYLETSRRRSEIRFLLHRQPVQYAGKNGEEIGVLRDISCNGCSVAISECAISMGEQLTIKLPFLSGKDNDLSREIVAEVVRVEKDFFAVRYSNISDEIKLQLREQFILLSQQERKGVIETI